MSEACERVARSVALEKAYVHQVYQQISADPPSERGHVWPRVKQFLSELEPGSLVCDVGCGNGKYLDVNPSVFNIGADRCKRLSEIAREKDNEVLMCDNLALPFRDESFDAVLSVAVIHHFATTDRRVAALRELARVLRIGGKLIITVWAMEQRHRKFESQDVLVPWHRPQRLSTPSLELSTTTTSEEEGPPVYHAYTQSSDSDSTRSQRAQERGRKSKRHKGRSIDPNRPLSNSHSSSSLSSPNETCYSFVRRALQKLAGGKRHASGRNRPWLLDTWTACTQDPSCRRPDPDGCEHLTNLDDIQDLPIELRRLEDYNDLPTSSENTTKRGTPPMEPGLGQKSKSLTDIFSASQNDPLRSRSSVPCLRSCAPSPTQKEQTTEPSAAVAASVITSQPKPKLVKQKQSHCDDEIDDEGGDEPTDMRDLVKRLPDFKISVSGESRRVGGVFKQSSMNEELMSTDRLREKERVRQNIQKQASLNEEFLFRRQRTFDSLRDTIFSASTAKRFQLLKTGLTNKIKISTTGIEKVAGASFKSGFVRILQGWKGDVPSQRPPPTPPPKPAEDKNGSEGERRHSREEGSDSSKDSSLQSDTSVDSEDSFASVIFIPKPDQTSPPLNSSPTTAGPSPGPTSPKFKFQSGPMIKQPSLPTKYPGPTSPSFKPPKQHSLPTSPKFKYQMPPLSPGFLKTIESQTKLSLLNSQCAQKSDETKPAPLSKDEKEKVKDTEVKPELNVERKTAPIVFSMIKPKPGVKGFPIVRRSESLTTPGCTEPKPLPKLLSLELFNPETDDVDSDSSGLSSPDSISSVISVLTEEFSAESQEVQVKVSSSDAQSTSNSTNELNLSDQSISSLPNSKSPDTSITKSPDSSDRLDTSKSELITPVGPLSSSSESFFRRTEKPKVPERRSSKPPTEKPPTNFLEAVADVAISLEGAVDAVIQSSPRARRRLSDVRVVEDGRSLDEDLFKKCEKKRADEPYPNFEVCRYKSVDSEKIPLLSSSEAESEGESESRKDRSGSSWTRSERLHQKFGARARYERPVVRIIREDDSVEEPPAITLRQRRNFPSRSLSLYNTETLPATWNEEHRHLTDLSGKEENDLFSGGLATGIEFIEDSYLTQLNVELSNISRLTAELHERDNYLASLSDEDLSKELKNEKINPFYACNDQVSSNPFSSRFPSNPFLSDSTDPFRTDCSSLEQSDSTNQFDDSFEPSQVQSVDSGFTGKNSETTSEAFPRKPSIFTPDEGKPSLPTRGNSTDSPESDSSKREFGRGRSLNHSMESNDPDASDGSKRDFAIPRDASRVTISSSLGHSMESSDPDGSESSRRDLSRKTASTASMGHSVESSDLSERTASDFSRKETSVSTGRTDDSVATDCSKDMRFADRRKMRCDGRSSSEETPRRVQLVRQKAAVNEPIDHIIKTESFEASLNGSTSQESLPSDNGGGSITYHRFYHVFREGELDQLINKYVENLHILSSYYDHANWCVIAEKVHVWTI